jgi:hypothetical protein
VAITKTYLGQNEDGTPNFHYQSDGHAVITGPAYGPMTTSDGVTYDVSEPVIEVASLAHAGEMDHLIGVHHEEHDHPHHDSSVPFVHECSDTCGALRRDSASPQASTVTGGEV